MKRIIYLYILCCLPLVLFAQSNSANSSITIHILLFTATHDSRVGSSCEETNKYFEKTFVPKLKNYTGCTVKTYFYSGTDFTLNKLNSTITNLNTSSNDVIFFYYAGHGYNKGNNDYPTLTLGIEGEELNSRTKDMLDIYNTLKRKSHRLLIVMAEACNKVYQSRNDIQSGSIRGDFSVDEDRRNHYTELFCDTSGDFLMSSCTKSEASHLATGRPGFFTCAFQDAFAEVTGKSYSGVATWNSLMNKTKSRTTNYAREIGQTQTPQWLKGEYSAIISSTTVTPSSSSITLTTDEYKVLEIYDYSSAESANAQYVLGVHYETGDIVRENNKKALYWYEMSLKNEINEKHIESLNKRIKNLKAQSETTKRAMDLLNLAICYNLGGIDCNVEIDKNTALYLYEKAVKNEDNSINESGIGHAQRQIKILKEQGYSSSSSKIR